MTDKFTLQIERQILESILDITIIKAMEKTGVVICTCGEKCKCSPEEKMRNIQGIKDNGAKSVYLESFSETIGIFQKPIF